ncbi:MAG TPA: sigma-70 family RNA polymerase sigma factor [Tepidisphaeraceae bacterium]|nr:sigma-70 family RNA polymerase sigma factor [Tepidisphaeraceae bacterium]
MEPPAGDFELLRRYAGQRDETAFAQLVRRHVDLVFSAALRRTRDRHLAEDVTQAVFVVLARKASHLGDRQGPMSAWLLKCVQYASVNALRMETRRQKHEETARGAGAASGGSGACSSNPTDVLIWHEIAGQLDDAVLKLPSLDRQAVLLRYFEGFSTEQIARTLNVSEGAARQRLSRALNKLRQRLSRHNGAMMSQVDAAVLAGLLASHAVRAAPAGLGTAALAAATGATASAGGVLIAKGAMTMMAWTKTKLVASIAAVVVIGGAGGIVAMNRAAAAPKPAAGAATPLAAETNKNDQISLDSAPPVVVKTVPEAGSDQIDASTSEIRVTFSKPMQDGSWSWSTWYRNLFPQTSGKPHYEGDHRTCVLPVKLEPGHMYAVWLNSENFGNFRDAHGLKAVPYLLVFETKK